MHPYNQMIIACIAQGDPPYLCKFNKDSRKWDKQFLEIDPETLATSMVFTPEGNFLLVSNTKGCISVFNVSSGMVF